MATNTGTLTLEIRDAGKLDVDWGEVIEKVNSTPDMPPKGDPVAAEVEGASPQSTSSSEGKGHSTKVDSSPMIRLVPKSKEDNSSQSAKMVQASTSTQLLERPMDQHKSSDNSDFSGVAAKRLQPDVPETRESTLEDKMTTVQHQDTESSPAQVDEKSTQLATSSVTQSTNDHATSSTPIPQTDSDKIDSQQTEASSRDPKGIPLPAVTQEEQQDLASSTGPKAESPSTEKLESKNANSRHNSDTQTLVGASSPEHATEAREATIDHVPGRLESSETKINDNKKTLGVFGTLKRKISTNKLQGQRQENNDPPSTTTTKPSSSSPKSSPEHVEFQNPTPPASPMETKKLGGLFKSIRAAIKLSSKSSAKSPSIQSAKSPVTPVSPLSPLSGKPLEKTTTKSSQRSTGQLSSKGTIKHSDNQISHQQSQRRAKQPTSPHPTSRPSVRHPQRPVHATLRTASTWSPAASNPVLASNPNAKMYTVWPRYPIVDAQILQVQELLESFLPNDKTAIETSREPDSQVVIHYWKAPLTSEQADIVKENSFVSSIQLSKLDYDPSDLFC